MKDIKHQPNYGHGYHHLETDQEILNRLMGTAKGRGMTYRDVAKSFDEWLAENNVERKMFYVP